MCINDGLLRTWLDRELDVNEMSAIDQHLANCVKCCDKAKLLRARVERLADRFNCLSSDETAEQQSLANAQMALARFNIEQKRVTQLTASAPIKDQYWTVQYWLLMLTKLWPVSNAHFSAPQLLIAGLIVLVLSITMLSVESMLPNRSLIAESQTAQLIVDKEYTLPSASQIRSIDNNSVIINSTPNQLLTALPDRPANKTINKVRHVQASVADDFARPLAGQFKLRVMENGKRYLTERLGYQTVASYQDDSIDDVLESPILTRPAIVLTSYRSQTPLESAELSLRPDFRLIPKFKN